MIRDLYDNSIAAYKTGTKQTVNLVLDTIRIYFYNHERIQLKTGVAPLTLRHSA